MGRPNQIPGGVKTLPSVKLHLVKLDWVDGDYDAGGAYWGGGIGDNVYCAYANVVNPIGGNFFPFLQIFVRACSRYAAKVQVQDTLPNAKFYR